MCILSVKLEKICRGSNRICIRKVNWERATELMELELSEVALEGIEGVHRYEKIVTVLTNSLLESGAYIPSKRNPRAKIRPTWWTPVCDEALVKKKDARRIYLLHQNKENLDFYLRAEYYVLEVLKRQEIYP